MYIFAYLTGTRIFVTSPGFLSNPVEVQQWRVHPWDRFRTLGQKASPKTPDLTICEHPSITAQHICLILLDQRRNCHSVGHNSTSELNSYRECLERVPNHVLPFIPSSLRTPKALRQKRTYSPQAPSEEPSPLRHTLCGGDVSVSFLPTG